MAHYTNAEGVPFDGVPFMFKGVTLPPDVECFAFPMWKANPDRVEFRDEKLGKGVALNTTSNEREINQAYRTLTAACLGRIFGDDIKLYTAGLDLGADREAEIAAEADRRYRAFSPMMANDFIGVRAKMVALNKRKTNKGELPITVEEAKAALQIINNSKL